ncbi:hypothetical protein HETIRDRAFT_47650 [Heterobasidion irregulare TC 32-1]|uniref:Long chronological lifespan protein 2 n=1 Tax=Heterobasidion irregulare (strain TC 32-1) TaxID=747525 RepID=W4KD79_HETIT|nr:uncharacterized protein HETIRDRAFT_47650 [Heterobasidion irregulare TC 32-1]ETW83704.1 hypothetical protein HETIRDRAFT_47650 [Heterobasidion irregulare TC 32-1]
MASAQFQFFDGMFGQRQQQQQQPSGASQWATHADSTSCSEYLCPATLACVTRPEECPCPHVQDVKCVVPDDQDRDHGTVLCVRGGSDCAAVEQLGKKFTK